jgi:hypothetical protein
MYMLDMGWSNPSSFTRGTANLAIGAWLNPPIIDWWFPRLTWLPTGRITAKVLGLAISSSRSPGIAVDGTRSISELIETANTMSWGIEQSVTHFATKYYAKTINERW